MMPWLARRLFPVLATAILVAAGHASDGKAHYPVLCQRLVQRGYVVLSWDPVGQAERS